MLDDAARHGYPLEVRFAALVHDLGKGVTPKEEWPAHRGHELRSVDLARAMCTRLRVPSDCVGLALLVARYHTHCHRAHQLRANTLVDLLYSCDAWRKSERFTKFLNACAADARGREGFEQVEYPQAEYLAHVAAAARAVDAAEVASAARTRAR